MQDPSYQDRAELARLITHLLESWGARPVDQIALLALPKETRTRAVRHYQDGTPLPDQPPVWERVEHVLGIADALRTTYPRNGQMGALWMNTRNRRFDDRTPLASMIEDGLEGVVAVRCHLDCAYAWHLDDVAHGRR